MVITESCTGGGDAGGGGDNGKGGSGVSREDTSSELATEDESEKESGCGEGVLIVVVRVVVI